MSIKLNNYFFPQQVFSGVCFCPHFIFDFWWPHHWGWCWGPGLASAASSAAAAPPSSASPPPPPPWARPAATLPPPHCRFGAGGTVSISLQNGKWLTVRLIRSEHAPSRFDSPKVKECLFRLVCFSFISSRFSHWSLENNDEDMMCYTQSSKLKTCWCRQMYLPEWHTPFAKSINHDIEEEMLFIIGIVFLVLFLFPSSSSCWTNCPGCASGRRSLSSGVQPEYCYCTFPRTILKTDRNVWRSLARGHN